MAVTTMAFWINQVNATVSYAALAADYLLVDLTYDTLDWTTGDTVVINHKTGAVPTSVELNAAATLIPDTGYTTVPLCLYADYDGVSGFYTHTVVGMGVDGRYVFCFRFDGPTATIPRLEAWNDSDHDTCFNQVLGGDGVSVETPANSWVKAIETLNGGAPGAGWVAAGQGTALAGALNYLVLDTAALSGAKDLYCNIAIRIPYTATPSADLFVLTVRYTYL